MIVLNNIDTEIGLDQNWALLTQENAHEFIIYTAVFGDFDTLNEVQNPNFNIGYFCFTDNENLSSNTWKIIYCKGLSKDPRLFAKVFKVFPHKIFKNAKLSLWLDGNYSIRSNHTEFFNLYDNLKHIKFYSHTLRDCIFQEAKVIQKEMPEYDPMIIEQQMQKYKVDGMPSHQGLINGAIILRNHDSELMIKLMDEWWSEIYNFSIRDQLSFNYINWRNGNHAEYFQEEITNFIYFLFQPHSNSKKAGVFFTIKIHIKSIIGRLISYVRNKR